MRTIDADDLVKQIDEFPTMPSFLDILEMIKEAPTIDIVYCKECKWRDQFGCALEIVDKSDRPNDDDYCSFGERKGADE